MFEDLDLPKLPKVLKPGTENDFPKLPEVLKPGTETEMAPRLFCNRMPSASV
jgi:hypothetical protein